MRKAGTNETVFKFHRTNKVDAGATVFVWSSDIGANHDPPANIVMKSQKWFVADNMTTTLLNNEGEVCRLTQRLRDKKLMIFMFFKFNFI